VRTRRLPPRAQLDLIHQRQDAAIRQAREADRPHFAGSGIVMVAGGARCFTSAYVALAMLRRVVCCTLPIQIWHLGPDEMSPHMASLLAQFDVELVDAFAVRKQFPIRRLTGWECKAYAILHSPFRHSILLDADNVPLIDPARLLEAPEYGEHGAIFWPDVQSLDRSEPAWQLCRVAYRDEPEVESGQLVIDTERSWVPLNLAVHFNAWSDIYFRYFYGDKETFHLAWRHLGQPYAMPEKLPRRLFGIRLTPESGNTRMRLGLEHHDFEGRPIFYHRTGAEWVLFGLNPSLGRASLESRCLAVIDELRGRWDGIVVPDPPADSCVNGKNIIETRRFQYRRVGVDERLVDLEPDGRIGLGADENETAWRLQGDPENPTLVISREDADICTLTHDKDGIWRGRWLWYEQMPVELIPIGLTCPA
jgi:hypothetical protein